MIDGRYKLVIHDRRATADGGAKRELFDLEADPAEKTNLIDREPQIAERLSTQMLEWQRSVLNSLTGADYAR